MSTARIDDARVRVLSLQTTLLGNRTYGELLRRFIAPSTLVDLDARWAPEAHEMRTRGLRSLCFQRLRSRYVRERNLDLYKTRFELGMSLLARRALEAAVRERRPDVVHIHPQSVALLAGDVMRQIPTVVTADMTVGQTAQQEVAPGSRWTYAPSGWLDRRMLHEAAAVVTFSRWAADAMIAENGLAPERVHIIPPGTDLTAFDAIRAVRRPRRDGETISLLFVGGEFARKGGELLARTFIERFSGQNIQLNVVTHSNDVPVHAQIVVHRNVQAFSDAWSALYANADAFVMPTDRDATPFVFVEAMATGIPTIGTAVGSIGETIVDGETGYVIAPGDARALGDRLERLVTDAARRQRFGAAGRERAEQRYDVRRNMAQLERVFVDVAAPRANAAVSAPQKGAELTSA